ncbi:IclR family transcriptional regulator [Frigidibacter sp. ROC022]|uniref:IclR family transcriptional regulator n=1 Tax=Frigidibacter sp. ROC022 TaxID=2971796 RepID=UPI00215B4CB1|nr:IclR family transcriptional regulator [Frigidibacter sp. ROC022]MCR8726161.1 IclR family transcriptional regulator [Frigidibacter sp. ROC022]
MHQGSTTDRNGGTGSTDGPTYKVNVLERAISILQAFSSETPRMSLSEIARATGLHRSTALRLLSTLTHAGMVNRDAVTGRYALGYEVIAMAEVARIGTGIVDCARPVIREMSERLNETVVLSVRSGDFRVNVEQVIGNQVVRSVVELGNQKPLTIGVPSLLILSSLPTEEVHAIAERVMPLTLAQDPEFSLEKLDRRLTQIRSDGYYMNMTHFRPDGTPGSSAIAAPIRARRGEVVATISVSLPIGRMTEATQAEAIAEALRGAEEVSARLGQAGHAV